MAAPLEPRRVLLVDRLGAEEVKEVWSRRGERIVEVCVRVLPMRFAGRLRDPYRVFKLVRGTETARVPMFVEE